ncbi:MAG TPA: VIT domain-containing protein [Flavisolibacter sp.]|jgi:TonB-dependent SusC/RagA subfamily outer membrane receptor|nr:VIT domain-containing protein [Flavisolibacter sp.]
MKKVLLAILAFCSLHNLTAQNNRLLDQPMQINSMNIRVNADCFTATTFVEIEFYNPSEKEIEGLYRFALQPGQVITAFQLELNGHYRDGSIEEKWKARAAYNTIVGKRVDPALLSLEWNNNYRLNIYPVPPKGSRKVTITIQQLLKEANGRLWYRFTLNKKDTAKQLKASISTTGCAYPATGDGFVANESFQGNNGFYKLEENGQNIPLWEAINFSFPLNNTPSFCIRTKNRQNYFALRVHQEMPHQLPIHPKKLLVYWDVSFSSSKRNIEKEIGFLKQFMMKHETEQLTIIAFADQSLQPEIFYPRRSKTWTDYLKSMEYDGATRMDQLNFSDTTADAIFLFTDGYVTYGSRWDAPVLKPLFAISSLVTRDSNYLKALVGNSGGTFIDLAKQTVSSALAKASYTTNKLLSIKSSTGKTVFKKTSGENDFIIYGTLPVNDTLNFIFGTSAEVERTEKLVLKKDAACIATGIDRLAMLFQLYSLNQCRDWEDILEFGLKEKIVTANTSYIVLEKTEDYIKYNIAPPKELEEECASQGYITKSTKTWRRQLRDRDSYDMLNTVVTAYNERLKQWDPNSSGISLSRVDFEKSNNVIQAGRANINAQLSGSAAGLDMTNSSLNEVVVVGYGTALKRSLTYSVVTVQSTNIYGSTVDEALAGRVPGIMVTPSAGYAGSATSIQIRGRASLSNKQPLYVLDGFPVEGDINNLVSINDIESITILKDATAAAIYGSRSYAGAIVITTKKYRPYYKSYSYSKPYKLKDMEDEDYLQEIKAIELPEKLRHYKLLQQQYINNASFYVDMAKHFFESGLKADANKMLLNAAEVSNGSVPVLLALAYTYEEWKEFDKAIEVYKQVLSILPASLSIHRNLGWALYESGKMQEAVEIFYNAIKLNLDTYEDYNGYYKASMLSDMNAIITMYRDSLNLSAIPSILIKPMPVDLRIVLEGNVSYLNNMQIKEPGGKECSWNTPLTNNAGYISRGWNYWEYTNEYNIVKAAKGKYSISINYYDRNYYNQETEPRMVRIICFKNFGKKDQSISIQNVIMNNQNGNVEVGEVQW